MQAFVQGTSCKHLALPNFQSLGTHVRLRPRRLLLVPTTQPNRALQSVPAVSNVRRPGHTHCCADSSGLILAVGLQTPLASTIALGS